MRGEPGSLYAVMAIKLNPRNDAERWLFQRSGYGTCDDETSQYVISGLLDPEAAPNSRDMLHFSYDGCGWLGEHHNEAMNFAQDYISQNWDELSSGDLIDTLYLQEKRALPRESDRPVEYGGRR